MLMQRHPQAPAASGGYGSRIHGAAILFVVAIGILLRFYHLSFQSFWIDEAFTWTASRSYAAATIDTPNPPLYYFIVMGWTYLFGVSEFAIRSVSAIFSILMIPALYFFASEWVEKKVALLAAIYFSISSFQIFYAQEARSMAMFSFLVLLSTALLWRALRGTNSLKYWFLYVLVSSVATYTHFIVLYFMLGHLLFVLVEFALGNLSRAKLRSFVIAGVAIFLAFLPMLIRVLKYSQGSGQQRRYMLLKFPQAYFSMLFGDSLIPMDEAAIQDIPGTLSAFAPYLILACVTALLLAVLLIRGKQLWTLRLPLIMAFAPALMCWLVSVKLPMFDERYMLPASPFLYLLVAAALLGNAAPPISGKPILRLVATIGLLAALSVSLYNYYWNPRFGKEQWRELVQYVASQSPEGPQTRVLADPDYLAAPLRYYQTSSMQVLNTNWDLLQVIPTDDQALPRYVGGCSGLWLVQTHQYNQIVKDQLSQACVLIEEKHYPRAKGIMLYRFGERAAD